MQSSRPLLIGWAGTNLTPEWPTMLAGQFHGRVSEGVMDPLTGTALALESPAGDGPAEAAILIGCDLLWISNGLRDAVRAELARMLPDFDSGKLVLHATHTHAAPDVRLVREDVFPRGVGIPTRYGVSWTDLGIRPPDDYVQWAAQRLAAAAAQAWRGRAPGAVSYGLGHAVVGFNRRVVYRDGAARMYGDTADPDFSHIEGGADSDVNVLAVWDAERRLSGVLINVACPAQVDAQSFRVSADYWHDLRLELRRRLGEDLFVLPQCSAAGDQSPRVLIQKPAEERMERLAGRTQRQTMAVRIADAVTGLLPHIVGEADAAPRFAHRVETPALTRRRITEADARDADAEAADARANYERMADELRSHPDRKQTPRWYVPITQACRLLLSAERVRARYEEQDRAGPMPVELHALRIGDVALVTNPFELYLDYGLRIKARSPALQTFVAQLAGPGTYLPTERAVAGRSYGALPANTPVGPEGGGELVEVTLRRLNELWER